MKLKKDNEEAFQAKVLKTLRRLPYVQAFKASDFYVRGLPDIIICANGHFVAWELKARKNASKRPLQEYTLQAIRDAGGHATIVYPSNFEEEVHKLSRLIYGGPPGCEIWYANWRFAALGQMPLLEKKISTSRLGYRWATPLDMGPYFERRLLSNPNVLRVKSLQTLVKGIPDLVFCFSGAFFAYKFSTDKLGPEIYIKLSEAGALGSLHHFRTIENFLCDLGALEHSSYQRGEVDLCHEW